MKFKLEINCDNAAFGKTDEDRGVEVARLLSRASEQVSCGCIMWQIHDANGNNVGGFDFVEPRPE